MDRSRNTYFRKAANDRFSRIARSTLMYGRNGILSFAGITQVFAYNFDLLPDRPWFFNLLKYFNLKAGIGTGLLLVLSRLGLILYAAR